MNERLEGGVCRDFLRNTCRRGKRCKYQHSPEPEEQTINTHSISNPSGSSVLFCHDFQNKGCPRRNCRFVHSSREEEEVFRESGRLPFNAAVSAHLQGLVPNEMLQGQYPRQIQKYFIVTFKFKWGDKKLLYVFFITFFHLYSNFV